MNELLAPVGFATVQSKLDESIKAAQRGSVGEADALATAGMEALTKVNADAAQSADLFREFLDARVRAEEAGAWQVLPDKASALDGQLRDAASLVEDGKIEAAKKTRQTLIDGYTKLELKSLKEGAVEVARATIASAKDKGGLTVLRPRPSSSLRRRCLSRNRCWTPTVRTRSAPTIMRRALRALRHGACRSRS
jgi:soluble cytochrome b562